MGIVMQTSGYISSAQGSNQSTTFDYLPVINVLNDLSKTLQNVWWLVILIFTLCVIFSSIFLIRKRANKFTKKQINCLIRSGKYIPSVFVELNGCKEMMRYFIYKKKWKKRLIKNFNFVYDNAYGEILKKAYENPSLCYKLNRKASLEEIEKATKAAFDFHRNCNSSTIVFNPNYKESKILFEALHYPYTDVLGDTHQCSSAANRKYFILTGSAGNGKTNLLCSISELLIRLKETVVFLNARDIEGDILQFLMKELKIPNICKKHTSIYLFGINLLLTICKKHFFVIIDAINENDSDGFGDRATKFINEITQYSRVNVIVSCRNEYYKERFRKYLVENVDIQAFEFDLKEQRYTSAAVDQIIRAYSDYFNFSGNISFAVRSVLSKQLLLMRIFFEVNKNSTTEVLTIRKHEIFGQYIETVKQTRGENVIRVLDAVSDFMIDSENYTDIDLSELENVGIASNAVKNAVDSSILLSKKLVCHEGTIAKDEKEVLHFVFDELRDYYIARRILLKNVSADSVNGEAVLDKLKHLKSTGAPCEEGVIHYCYMFFRTDEVVKKTNQTENACNTILDLYRISEKNGKKQSHYMLQKKEFQNLGLRIILTSGIELSNFEISYIQDCLKKNPCEDGKMFFDVMLEGTLYGGIYNLDIYLEVLFGLKDEEAILNVLGEIKMHNVMDDYYGPRGFIQCYSELKKQEGKLQIQKIVELYLLCFELYDVSLQKKLEDFFFSLPTHDKVRAEMWCKMREACS